MAWTNTGGGDHEGVSWTPADTTTVGGVHYNISTFTVTTGYTINIDTVNKFEVYANSISVIGTINGNYKGYAAGNGAGQGGDAGAGLNSGGGGAGYGGAGGAGGHNNPGAGGAAQGSNSTVAILMGAGGGAGANSGPISGGAGGAGILLSANTVSITGTINCNGANGNNAGEAGAGGGGGGAGGGIMLIGCAVTATGTFTANGGNGGNGQPVGGNGGGGGGGRIKIFYRSLNSAGISTSVTGGTPGAGATGGVAGAAGTYYTDEIAQCTSTLEFGQTFTPGVPGRVAVSAVVFWVLSVATSGDFTLTIYDDTGKGTNYGSKSITVSGTGENTWTFDAWIELPDGTSQYYMELVADAGGDIDLGIYGNEPLSGEDYYFNVELVERFAAYFKIDIVGHIIDTQVYNTTDTSVKMDTTNTMLLGAVHRINTDGTGTVEYDDDFTTAKWEIDSVYSSVTHDTGNDEIDIADDGYIYWKKDTKFPINGIPPLTAQVNITSGTPTIQISEDAATWYDIDTAIVDDVETVYPLDSSGNLSLAGKTIFYWRFDCVKAAPATASIKSFELDINIHTIYAKNPVINKGATASTFRIDQDAASGMECEVKLIFPDRWWA